jgi:large subunit ribosomal protein L35
MPKLKTHKGAADRFHVTGTGKVMRTKGGKSHLRRHKPNRVKAQYDETQQLSPHNIKEVRKLLPNAGI